MGQVYLYEKYLTDLEGMFCIKGSNQRKTREEGPIARSKVEKTLLGLERPGG